MWHTQSCCCCRVTVPVFARILRAALYASTVFLSFFLMLVFMTYNVRSSTILQPAGGPHELTTLFHQGIPHSSRRSGRGHRAFLFGWTDGPERIRRR